MIACAFAAMIAGDCVMVLAGRCGTRIGLVRRCVGAARVVTLERAFARHGVVLLLGGRFVPGLRATMLIAAGVARLPLRRLFLVDGIAALAGTTLWIAIGWQLGPHLQRARAIVGSARGVAIVAATFAIVVAIVIDWRRRKSILTSTASSAREASPIALDRASRSRHHATHT